MLKEILEYVAAERGLTLHFAFGSGEVVLKKEATRIGILYLETGTWMMKDAHLPGEIAAVDAALDKEMPLRIPDGAALVRTVRTRQHLFTVKRLWPADEFTSYDRYEIFSSTLGGTKGRTDFVRKETLDREFQDRLRRMKK